MKTKLCLLLISISISFIDYAQKWGRVTESEFVNEAMDIETDASGNSYVTGYITGETAFGTTINFPSAQGNGDIYVAKYASNGQMVWVKKFGGNYSDRAYDLALDNSGNIFITGQFYGTVDFDGQSITSTANSKDIFLVKLTNDGETIWARSEGGSASENAYGITCDNAGNVILTGQFEGNSVITGQNFTSMIDPQTGLSSYDLFISKYDTNGNPLWVKTGVGKYEDRGLAVSCDNQNNIYMTAQFSDTLTFDNMTVNNGAYNVGFVAKLAPTGNIVWVNTLKAGFLIAYDIEVDEDELVITGESRGTIYYQNNGSVQMDQANFDKNIFALKVNLAGAFQWVQQVGSDNAITARSVSIDAMKNIYITGHFECSLTEFHEDSTAYYNSVGFKDVYLWKLDHNGAVNYLKTIGSKLDDNGHGIAILGTDNVVIAGSNTNSLNIPIDDGTTYQSNSDYFMLDMYGIDQGFCHLHGDVSLNAFVTNAVFQGTPNYNYFFNQSPDSLLMQINWGIDTVHTCDPTALSMVPYTYYYAGPDYSYLWNTGETEGEIYISNGGEYWGVITRLDECSNGSDTIQVEFHDYPSLPLMTDNLGLAINEPGSTYYGYAFCHPDSVQIWFSNLEPGLSIQIGSGTNVFTDTLPHFYTEHGFVDVSNEYCTSYGAFSIYMNFPEVYDYDPYLTLVDIVDFNDSLAICLGQHVIVENHDSTNNLTAQFGLLPDDPYVFMEWDVLLNGNSYPHVGHEFFVEFSPNQTGDYVVQFTVNIGYDNLCGVDTTSYFISDTFHFEVLPLPAAPDFSILGDNLLCPNGSVYLVVDNPVAGFNWSGPGITWVSSTNDSIQATIEGVYNYSGVVIDPVNGCSIGASEWVYLEEKVPPLISSLPSDAIICPYDSVLLSVPAIYLSYDWTGPDGSGLSTTSTHEDDDQGFYYVTVLDDEGCYLTSPPFELREYSTPYLTVEPSNILCEGDDATISVIIDGEGSFQWQNPLGFLGDELTVTTAGWYVCEITQCGITILDSIEIIDGTFSIQLNYSDTLLCFGQQTTISTEPGLNDYQWCNDVAGVSFIEVEEGGIYFVKAMNGYGCEAFSDSILIQEVENSQPPQLTDTYTCIEGNFNLSSAQTVNWYLTDSTFISSGSVLNVNITSDTLFLVSYAPEECPIVYSDVFVELIDSIVPFTVYGDVTLCFGQELNLTTDAENASINWELNAQIIGTNDTLISQYDEIANATSITLIVFNECFSETEIVAFELLPVLDATIAEDSLAICYYDDLELTIAENYDSVVWSGYFGTIDEVELYLIPTIETGFIYFSAIDSEGCSTNSDSIYVFVSNQSISIDNNLNYSCMGDSVYLFANVESDSILWSTPFGNSTDSLFSFTINDITSGTYSLFMWDSLGCEYLASLTIDSNPIPLINFPYDTIVCLDEYIGSEYLTDSLTFYWNGIGYEDSVNIQGNQWYNLTVENQFGCQYSDSIYVISVNCEDELPNVFTPNGDGVNDYFYIDEAIIYPNNKLLIFNRWGNVILEEHNYQNTFNGEGLADGVYYFIFYQNFQQSPEQFFEGFVHIIR